MEVLQRLTMSKSRRLLPEKIYTSEQSIGEVVEMLKRFKTSGNIRENEIFACMVHNLFDEYRFFSSTGKGGV
jgi:hypothetical protein